MALIWNHVTYIAKLAKCIRHSYQEVFLKTEIHAAGAAARKEERAIET